MFDSHLAHPSAQTTTSAAFCVPFLLKFNPDVDDVDDTLRPSLTALASTSPETTKHNRPAIKSMYFFMVSLLSHRCVYYFSTQQQSPLAVMLLGQFTFDVFVGVELPGLTITSLPFARLTSPRSKLTCWLTISVLLTT